MSATDSSRSYAMTAEDREMYWRWARMVVGIYGIAWLALSIAAFAAPIGH